MRKKYFIAYAVTDRVSKESFFANTSGIAEGPVTRAVVEGWEESIRLTLGLDRVRIVILFWQPLGE